ncbi:MAG: hypothetical protein K1X89_12875, partial [Myxococcaceae bacterium]|nr:hypothetical protein [Myxococcaceae bacterium]
RWAMTAGAGAVVLAAALFGWWSQGPASAPATAPAAPAATVEAAPVVAAEEVARPADGQAQVQIEAINVLGGSEPGQRAAPGSAHKKATPAPAAPQPAKKKKR